MALGKGFTATDPIYWKLDRHQELEVSHHNILIKIAPQVFVHTYQHISNPCLVFCASILIEHPKSGPRVKFCVAFKILI